MEKIKWQWIYLRFELGDLLSLIVFGMSQDTFCLEDGLVGSNTQFHPVLSQITQIKLVKIIVSSKHKRRNYVIDIQLCPP